MERRTLALVRSRYTYVRRSIVGPRRLLLPRSRSRGYQVRCPRGSADPYDCTVLPVSVYGGDFTTVRTYRLIKIRAVVRPDRSHAVPYTIDRLLVSAAHRRLYTGPDTAAGPGPVAHRL